MSLANLGSCTFQDVYAPAKGKSEWGMDTLTRRLSGARSLLDAYIATLAQGQVYQGYYLQSWQPDEDPVVANITLEYKGLLTGGTPTPTQETEIVSAVGRTTKDYSTEGTVGLVNLGRLYANTLIASTGEAPAPGDFGTSVQFIKKRYALSAYMEFTYKSPQTIYRYISVGRPVAARFSSVGFDYTLIIEDARIVTSDGMIFSGRTQENFFDLTPVAENKVVSFMAKPVIGSPYWECQDIIKLELVTNE